MTKYRLKIAILILFALIMLTGAGRCCPGPEESENENVTSGTNQNVNKNTNQGTASDETTDNKSPVVTDITVTQLHKTYEELPHKYQLRAIAQDPEGEALTYQWSVDCGYFPGSTNDESNITYWYYDQPGECINATVTVYVYDVWGARATMSLKPFE
jgi:hypothetical protein